MKTFEEFLTEKRVSTTPIKDKSELEKELYDAGIASDIPRMKELLDQGVSPNVTKSGRSLFMRIISRDNEEAFDLLLKYGVDVNQGDSKKTPLMVACEEISREYFVKKLIKAKADVNGTDYRGNDVLYRMCLNAYSEHGNQNITSFLTYIDLLLDNGAKLSKKLILLLADKSFEGEAVSKIKKIVKKYYPKEFE